MRTAALSILFAGQGAALSPQFDAESLGTAFAENSAELERLDELDELAEVDPELNLDEEYMRRAHSHFHFRMQTGSGSDDNVFSPLEDVRPYIFKSNVASHATPKIWSATYILQEITKQNYSRTVTNRCRPCAKGVARQEDH